MSRKIEDLDLDIQVAAGEMLAEMRADKTLRDAGVTDIFISETRRDLAVQMAYYSRGRMAAEDVRAMYKAAGLYVPTDAECATANTWTLKSNHLDGRAIDLVPFMNGKLNWNAPAAVWQRMGEIGRRHGFVWGGDWKGRTDCPHFEKRA